MERVLEDRIDRGKQRLNRVVQEVAKTDGQQNLEGGPLGCAGVRLGPYRRKCCFAGHLWLRFINHCLPSTWRKSFLYFTIRASHPGLVYWPTLRCADLLTKQPRPSAHATSR